jgi:allophanate hydrolase
MLNNIVGLKPSKGLISTKGVVPAAASVDCVSIFARTVDCAWTVLMQAKGYDSTDVFSKDMKLKMAALKPKFGFGVPDELKFFGDALSEKAFEEALLSLEAMGGERVVIEYKPLANVAAMLYEDAFVAERYSAIREFFDKNESVVIEPVRSIIAKGRNYGAVDLYDAQLKLLQAARKVQPMWATIDIMVVPTAPTHYKTVGMLADPVGLNRNLGTYTNFVNLLDYCAISIPSCIREDGMPFGITLIGQSGDDYTIAELGQRYHHSRGLFAGATGVPLGEPLVHLSSLSVKETVQIAVVGAHLEGMPLHHQLTSKNATFVRKCRTAAEYKLFAIANSTPPKPALVHVGPGDGASIEIEIYELSFSAVGEFLTQIPAPLGLGTLLADDGASVKGFIAEPRAMVGAVDITSYGGWRAYIFRSNEEEHKAV